MALLPVNKMIPSTTTPLPSRICKKSSSTATIRCQQQPAGAVTPAAETAAVSTSNVEAARLEPRVEERDGYWVLKEKFREGINPAEKVKIEKDPMKLFIENGISDLAALSMEEIDQSKDSKDDIDVRLKWLGLFHRHKHHLIKAGLKAEGDVVSVNMVFLKAGTQTPTSTTQDSTVSMNGIEGGA